MSKLEIYLRPLVLFDASNKEHRQLYFNYLATGGWAGCPYRFAIAEDYGNLIGHIQRELLEYYMGREFKGKIKETRVLVPKEEEKG